MQADTPLVDTPVETPVPEVAPVDTPEESVHDTIAKLLASLVEHKKHHEEFMKATVATVKGLQKDVKKMKPKKAARTEQSTQRVNGLEIPVLVGDTLKAFLGLDGEEYTRKEITGLVTKYIKEHKLQNPANGREILLDTCPEGLKLKEILEPDQPLTFFNIQRYLNKHYTKKPVTDLPSATPEAPVEPKAEPPAEEAPVKVKTTKPKKTEPPTEPAPVPAETTTEEAPAPAPKRRVVLKKSTA